MPGRLRFSLPHDPTQRKRLTLSQNSPSAGAATRRRLTTTNSDPQGLFVDRDGTVYVAEHGGGYLATHVARIAPGGDVTEWNDTDEAPEGVAPGPGGSIWFTQGCAGLGVLEHGKLEQFIVPGITGESAAIVRAPDGTLWFSQDGRGRSQR